MRKCKEIVSCKYSTKKPTDLVHDSNKSQIVFMHNFFAPKPMTTQAQTVASPVDTDSAEIPVGNLDFQSIVKAASYVSDETEGGLDELEDGDGMTETSLVNQTKAMSTSA